MIVIAAAAAVVIGTIVIKRNLWFQLLHLFTFLHLSFGQRFPCVIGVVDNYRMLCQELVQNIVSCSKVFTFSRRHTLIDEAVYSSEIYVDVISVWVNVP